MYLSPTTHGERGRTFRAGRFTLVESTYQPTTALPPHYHSVAALMFATRGSFVETAGRRTFECAAFDAIVRPAGAEHTNQYGGERTSCVIVNVSPEIFLSPVVVDGLLAACIPRVSCAASARICAVRPVEYMRLSNALRDSWLAAWCSGGQAILPVLKGWTGRIACP